MKNTVFIILFILMNLNIAHTAFENVDQSTEGTKTADACSARFLGVPSMYYNPAGLAGMKKRELNVQYSKMMFKLENDSLNYLNFMVGYPFAPFQLGFGFNMFSSDLYSEQVVSLSGSKKILKVGKKHIAVGLRIKLLRLAYEENDYTLLDRLFIEYGYTQSALGIDFGVLGYSKKGLSLGLALKNINKPDMTLEGTEHRLPVQLKFGSAYKLKFKKKVYSMDEINFAFDTNYKYNYYSFHFGVEPTFFKYSFTPGLGFAIGNKSLRYITAGLSYRLSIEGYSYNFQLISYYLKINYAFKFHLGGMYKGTYGDHVISASFMF